MHSRTFPKTNRFTYGLYYLACPLDALAEMPLGVDRPGLLSFYRRDHGGRDGGDLDSWIRNILNAHNITSCHQIVLVAMPRVLGYVFNPVSFWICLDHSRNILAVLCEVNNTFGESHSYLCAHDDRRPIAGDDWLHGEKIFHVSPFLEREGDYRFRFSLKGDALGIWIDHYAADGRAQLLTALTGRLKPMTKATLAYAFLRYPLVTFKAVYLIHWQAIKLVLKGVKYVPKPRQSEKTLTSTAEIKKM